MTLLELILVLAISASLVLMGFSMYQRYRLEQDFNQLKYNVDVLMQSMRLFYYANCGGNNGLLSPLRDPLVLDKPFSINILSQLRGKYYLTDNWPKITNLTDESFGLDGYKAKFNPKKVIGKKVANACYNVNGKIECGNKPLDKSEIIFWQLEVAVKIKDVDLAQRYWAYVDANCAVENLDDLTPMNCKTDSSDKGQILVWQTVPSDSVTNITSDAWLTTPGIRQFNLLYTHDPMYDLYDPQSQNSQYYLCGG